MVTHMTTEQLPKTVLASEVKYPGNAPKILYVAPVWRMKGNNATRERIGERLVLLPGDKNSRLYYTGTSKGMRLATEADVAMLATAQAAKEATAAGQTSPPVVDYKARYETLITKLAEKFPELMTD